MRPITTSLIQVQGHHLVRFDFPGWPDDADPNWRRVGKPRTNERLLSAFNSALRQALVNLKARGAIVVLIAHRPTVLSICDHLLVLANGQQQEFGLRDDVLRKISARPVPPPAAVGNLKVVSDTTAGGQK